MDAILTSIVSTIMLPLFLVMALCLIAGARPEPVVKAVVDLVIALIGGVVRMVVAIAGSLPAARRKPASGRSGQKSRAAGNRARPR